MNGTFQPVYFSVSVFQATGEGAEVEGMWPGDQWMVMNSQQGGGGRSGESSGDRRSDGAIETRNEAISSENSSRGWKVIVGNTGEADAENQLQAAMSREDEFRLGDGETGDGNILRRPVETDENQWTDDV